MTAPIVKVKPLVWSEVQTYGGKVWDASPSVTYPYRIVHYTDERNCFWVNALPNEKNDTLDAAKAAAQADYEARILSAIDTTDLEALAGAVLAEAAHLMPRYFGVWSSTGVHIGVWDDGATAAKVLGEYPRGVMRDLVDAQAILALNPTALTALDRAKREARVEGIFAAHRKAALVGEQMAGASRQETVDAICAAIFALIEAERGKP